LWPVERNALNKKRLKREMLIRTVARVSAQMLRKHYCPTHSKGSQADKLLAGTHEAQSKSENQITYEKAILLLS